MHVIATNDCDHQHSKDSHQISLRHHFAGIDPVKSKVQQCQDSADIMKRVEALENVLGYLTVVRGREQRFDWIDEEGLRHEEGEEYCPSKPDSGNRHPGEFDSRKHRAVD